ncbi:hypothetical protein V6N13_069065 [Hibiscus sabdariffa]|uniref:C2H2-type domain-containing protein n=1 Tax=Hibiscus sabdariffa TaxID=183260 RepID=A0ABR2QQ13_9ROSI
MDDQVTNTLGKGSVSVGTSDSSPLKPNKLMLKLKISEKIGYGGGGGSQHICPVCGKGFTSGKALGGHIRIHMNGNKASRHRKISKRQPRSGAAHRRAKSKKKTSNTAAASPDDDLKRDADENVSCCICNKSFGSMKSLFGHMRNHPERSWRGIRPPPSDKNSCCSSVSENDEALEVNQVKCSNSDMLKSLFRWKTNTLKPFEKSCFGHDDDIDDEIPEAAYCLMKLSRGDSFHKTPLKLEEDKVYKKPGFCTKNPSGEEFKVCSSKTLLDFDLNEPYVEGFDDGEP